MTRGEPVDAVWRTVAPAKVNLGLFVGATRADGRHELVSVMQSITLCDEVSLGPAPAGVDVDEVVCEGVAGPNLALSALAGFRAATGWAAPPQRVTVAKRVPVAAGLGGGSGDAAATLRLAHAASGLGSPVQLMRVAAELGADVPAQLAPGRHLATGVGDRLGALPALRAPLAVLVLPAAQGLSTADVYREHDRLGRSRGDGELARLERRLLEQLAGGAPLPAGELLANDLHDAALSLRPAIAGTLARARSCEPDAAFVSGSGPTVVALFAGEAAHERLRAALRAVPGAVGAAAVTAPVVVDVAHATAAPQPPSRAPQLAADKPC